MAHHCDDQNVHRKGHCNDFFVKPYKFIVLLELIDDDCVSVRAARVSDG
jgi:hypothetical protein